MMFFVNEVNLRYKRKKISRTPSNYADYILEELKVSPEELAEGNKFWREMLAIAKSVGAKSSIGYTTDAIQCRKAA